MGTVFWGFLCAVAFLGLFGLLAFIIAFAISQHAWSLVAAEAGIGAALALVMTSGRERRPKWYREEQRHARGED